MARGKEQIAMEFLEGLLEPRHIPADRFYEFMQELEGVEFLEDVKLEFEEHLVAGLRISARYIGPVKLQGDVPAGVVYSAKPSAESQKRVEAIYEDISKKTGFEFSEIRPDMRGDFCTADVFLLTPEFVDNEEPLTVRLYQEK